MVQNSAVIGSSAIPSSATLRIEETEDGFFLSGYVGNEFEKQTVLRNLGGIRKGKIEHAKFQTISGQLVDESFEVTNARFREEEFPDHRRLEFSISLKHVADHRDELR
jgi:hypothetical protein